MKDRYAFLRTTITPDGHIVALLANETVLGTSGVLSLRQAFKAHATPIMGAGVITATKAQAIERLRALKKQNVPENVAAYELALRRIEEREATMAKNNAGLQNDLQTIREAERTQAATEGTAFAVRAIQETFN